MSSSCPPLASDSFRCPTKWELLAQTLALLPRGRAWQTHEDVAEIVAGPGAQHGTYELGGSVGVGAEPTVDTLTVMQRFWAAFAEVLEEVHQRACALIPEFFCAETREMLPEWHLDYGFPDPCEPWDTLCAKVAAQGGATCAYLAEVAALRGWSVECLDCGPELDRAGCLEAGAALLCACRPNEIIIRVNLSESPAFTGSYVPMEAGVMMAGCHDPCPPSVEPLRCLIERVKPAHVRAIYEVMT